MNSSQSAYYDPLKNVDRGCQWSAAVPTRSRIATSRPAGSSASTSFGSSVVAAVSERRNVCPLATRQLGRIENHALPPVQRHQRVLNQLGESPLRDLVQLHGTVERENPHPRANQGRHHRQRADLPRQVAPSVRTYVPALHSTDSRSSG